MRTAVLSAQFGLLLFTLPEAEVVDSLATDLVKGMDASEVERRREQFGSNTIIQKE
jgi:hypothetical protein